MRRCRALALPPRRPGDEPRCAAHRMQADGVAVAVIGGFFVALLAGVIGVQALAHPCGLSALAFALLGLAHAARGALAALRQR